MSLTHISTGDPHVSAHNSERDALNELETQVQGKVSLPPNPQVGEMLRFNGTDWSRSATRLFEGSGSPEGTVAAPIGSRYIDIAGTNGAVEWLKIKGDPTSNTGWSLLFGDTDARNVASDIILRGTGVLYSAILRRYGNVVDFYVDIKMPTNTATPYLAYTLPVGFRPMVSRYGGLQDNKENASASTSVLADGTVNFYTIVAGQRDRYSGTWLTKNDWPAVLPGTAA